MRDKEYFLLIARKMSWVNNEGDLNVRRAKAFFNHHDSARVSLWEWQKLTEIENKGYTKIAKLKNQIIHKINSGDINDERILQACDRILNKNDKDCENLWSAINRDDSLRSGRYF